MPAPAAERRPRPVRQKTPKQVGRRPIAWCKKFSGTWTGERRRPFVGFFASRDDGYVRPYFHRSTSGYCDIPRRARGAAGRRPLVYAGPSTRTTPEAVAGLRQVDATLEYHELDVDRAASFLRGAIASASLGACDDGTGSRRGPPAAAGHPRLTASRSAPGCCAGSLPTDGRLRPVLHAGLCRPAAWNHPSRNRRRMNHRADFGAHEGAAP